jgi:16S rRNA processing protein RimM
VPRKPLRRNGTVTQNRILLGVVGRPHGVRGLVHVVSHAADPANLTAYGPLTDDRGRRFSLRWRGEGLAEVTELRDDGPARIADRTSAEKLVNTRLYINRAHLPEPDDAEEFYVADLVGITAVDAEGTVLGKVVTVHDYGAGSSLEIAKDAAAPLLVPFTRACVPDVDVALSRVTINLPTNVNLSHEMGLSCAADQGGWAAERADRSVEGEGERVGRQPRKAAYRPDHPRRPRNSRRSSSRLDPAPGAGEV